MTVERQVLWHDLECGRYRADLPLWRELAAESAGQDGRVLDIGAGTGRVALDLARSGHAVTALDVEQRLLDELERRAAGLPVQAVLGDARSFQLESREHRLCIVPMQTVQLLRGPAERRALFERAHAHVREGALVALAIVTEVDEFDARRGGIGPAPDTARIGSELYVSRPARVAVTDRFIRIERERFVADGPIEHDVIELERLDAEQLLEEGRAAGLRAVRTVTIAETLEHAGSEVVLLRA
ncbi:MAG TPA: class I SAM-dependent methyltransferase [Solirubrobacteraceae bacterium]